MRILLVPSCRSPDQLIAEGFSNPSYPMVAEGPFGADTKRIFFVWFLKTFRDPSISPWLRGKPFFVNDRKKVTLLESTKSWRPRPEVEPLPPPRPPKMALVVGAGAFRGFAHVGVIQILESNRIPIHIIVGTSVGSVVGSFYAYGYDALPQIQKMVSQLRLEARLE